MARYSDQKKPIRFGKKDRPTLTFQQALRQGLSRKKALQRICKTLNRSSRITHDVIELLTLFHFQADELTEAGVSYEVVKALETRHAFLMTD